MVAATPLGSYRLSHLLACPAVGEEEMTKCLKVKRHFLLVVTHLVVAEMRFLEEAPLFQEFPARCIRSGSHRQEVLTVAAEDFPRLPGGDAWGGGAKRAAALAKRPPIQAQRKCAKLQATDAMSMDVGIVSGMLF